MAEIFNESFTTAASGISFGEVISAGDAISRHKDHPRLSNLRNDCHISLKWFDDNGMKANPSRFKFMIMSSEHIEPQELMISDDVCIQSQTDIKVLVVRIDYRLTFNEHIRVCTLKAAMQ